jgi:hypothetical protein
LGDTGHLSQATSIDAATSWGNMNHHRSSEQDVVTQTNEKTIQILGYLKK